MGLLDMFKGGSGAPKCAFCKKETETLPFTKTVGGKAVSFCSKKCSRDYRIQKKKAARKPVDTGGGLPW